MNACAASVHCNLGNSTIGYLVLTAQPASIKIASPTAFVKPIHPGVLVLAGTAPAAAVIRTLTRQHTEDICVFNEYQSVEKVCKQVLFTLVLEAYLRSFKNKYTGYAKVKCLDILTHLWNSYCVLQDLEVKENDLRIKQLITAKALFEEFVENIDTAVDAVATQVP